MSHGCSFFGNTHHVFNKEDVKTKPHAVFVLKDAKTMRIVYVGCAWNLFSSRNSLYRSLSGTNAMKEYMDQCRAEDKLPNVDIIKWFKDRATAMSMKKTLIKRIRPVLNVTC